MISKRGICWSPVLRQDEAPWCYAPLLHPLDHWHQYYLSIQGQADVHASREHYQEHLHAVGYYHSPHHHLLCILGGCFFYDALLLWHVGRHQDPLCSAIKNAIGCEDLLLTPPDDLVGTGIHPPDEVGTPLQPLVRLNAGDKMVAQEGLANDVALLGHVPEAAFAHLQHLGYISTGAILLKPEHLSESLLVGTGVGHPLGALARRSFGRLGIPLADSVIGLPGDSKPLGNGIDIVASLTEGHDLHLGVLIQPFWPWQALAIHPPSLWLCPTHSL